MAMALVAGEERSNGRVEYKEKTVLEGKAWSSQLDRDAYLGHFWRLGVC